MKIIKDNTIGSYKNGKLDASISVKEINKRLGFDSQVGDPSKVKHEWHFMAKGHQCGVWDYYNVRWSTFGPAEIWNELFPGKWKSFGIED
jgi:hypothetical protein